MRISRLELRNYRQFRNADISFDRRAGVDLHVFIGRNTAGKTNILNAINWCLYADEPHVTSQYQGLEVPNLIAIADASGEKDISVIVELTVQSENRDYHAFRREHIYRVYDNQKPILLHKFFQARFTGEDENTVILKDEKAAEHVQRFVPKDIREFFFFDGERLDNYFREMAGQKINHAIFQIAQIDLLARVNRKLGELQRDLEKQAARLSPALEDIRNRLEKAKQEQEEIKSRLDKCETQLRHADEEATKYAKKLNGMPIVEHLEAERKSIENQLEGLQRIQGDKEKEKGEVLFEFGLLLNLHEALNNAVNIIDIKTKAREIPPAINAEILEEAIQTNRCVVCGSELSESSKECVKELLKEVSLSSDIADELHRIEGPLRIMVDKTTQYSSQIAKVSKELGRLQGQIDELCQRREEINNELAGYKVDEVRHAQAMRTEYEQAARKLREDRGRLKASRDDKDSEVEDLQKKLHTELKAERAAEELQLQIEVCSHAQEAASKAELEVMTMTREFIEQKTSKTFMELVWRSATYEGVTINEDYQISVHHSMGYDALGTLSAAERELLALSFTLALHEISGFDGPLIIDTPVARVSDKHRENFAQALLRVSKGDKQIILLFTPDEYSSSISRYLDEKAASRREIRLKQSEKESTVEEITV